MFQESGSGSCHVCGCCGNQYNTMDKDADELFCSFSCWEKVNCREPEFQVFEPITV